MKTKKILINTLTVILYFITLLSVTIVNAQDTKFTDIQNHWAENLIKEATNKNIIDGISATKFAPNEPLTYEQFITMLARTLTNYDYIEDKTSGCRMPLINVNKAYNYHKGDYEKAKEYRMNYLNNKFNFHIPETSNYLKELELTINGECMIRGFNAFKVKNYGKVQPYYPNYLTENIDGWALESIYQIPMIASFINHHNLLKNNGKNMSDFSAYVQKDGVKIGRNTAIHMYQSKTIEHLYNSVSPEYIYKGRKNQAMQRQDMALILFSFLDYEDQKLLKNHLDFYEEGSELFVESVDDDILNMKDFKSHYKDVPNELFANVVFSNENLRKLYDDISVAFYVTEAIHIDKYLYNNSIRNNVTMHITDPLMITSTPYILAVSDAGLLLGTSKTNFSPFKVLTRAEGLAVALRLEGYIKERYNLIKQ